MAVKAVFFDVGETLVDETREWEAIADRLSIPRFTFFGVLGGLALLGERYPGRRAFEILGVEQIPFDGYGVEDLYPDAIGCLRELGRRGYLVGIAGNAPRIEPMLRELVDVVGSSESWGVEKPAPEFFARIALEARCEPGEIAYVGDRVDNDIEPALAAGMVAVHIRRGPWGYLQSGRERAHIRIDSLAELPEALGGV